MKKLITTDLPKDIILFGFILAALFVPVFACVNNTLWAYNTSASYNASTYYNCYDLNLSINAGYISSSWYTQDWEVLNATDTGSDSYCYDNAYTTRVCSYNVTENVTTMAFDLLSIDGVGISSPSDCGFLASGGWMVNGTEYARKQNLTYTASVCGNNTKLYVNVTYDADMQDNFSDIRFGLTNGTLLEQMYIPYTGVYADFWILNPLGCNNTIYMYYKNNTPISSYNVTGLCNYTVSQDCLAYYDNFGDASLNSTLWDCYPYPTSTCTCTESSGYVEIDETHGSGSYRCYIQTDNQIRPTNSDYILSYDYWINSGIATSGYNFGYVLNPTNTNDYSFITGAGGDYGYTSGTTRLSYYPLVQQNDIYNPVDYSTWHTVKTKSKYNTWQNSTVYYTNGTYIGSDSTTNSSRIGGDASYLRIGLAVAQSNQIFRVDNLKYWDFVIDGESYSFGSEETGVIVASGCAAANCTIWALPLADQNYGYYTANIYNEADNTGWDFNKTHNETITFTCESSQSIQNLTSSGQQFILTDSPRVVKVDVNFTSTDDEYYRKQVPTCTWPCTEAVSFYLVDLASSTLTQLTLTMQDWIGLFGGAEVRFKRPILNSGNIQITSDLFDAEKKAILYLIKDMEYQIEVYKNGVTKSIGYVIIDADTEKTITIADIAFTPDEVKLYEDILYGSSIDANYVTAYYNDTSGTTTGVSWYVLNATSGAELYTVSSSCNLCSFSWNHTGNTTTPYLSIITAQNSVLGTINTTDPVNYVNDTAFFGEGVLTRTTFNWVAVLIIIGSSFVVGRLSLGAGALMVLAEVCLFSLFGWLNIPAVVLSLTFAMLVGIIAHSGRES